MRLKPNPIRKAKRQAKRWLKMMDYKPNGERETARRRKQIAEGRLKVSDA